jgi:hypothetical protein
MTKSLDQKLARPVFHEPAFGDGKVTADPTGFLHAFADDKEVYDQIEALLKKNVVSFEKSRIGPDELYTLAQAYGSRGPSVIKQIENAGRIVFHALGDSGATRQGRPYAYELSVSDQLTIDYNTNATQNRPSFLLHLGDIVYDFGEAQYYYDQFYAPFRDYPAPIFAIPGNHDSFIVPGTPAPQAPLVTFMRNFCAEEPNVTPEAASLHRTAMTQPGVYYALEAPFVRILCLFSNALEDPGVISSEGKRWENVPNHQIEFLEVQLKKIKEERYAGAVLIAVHHPPFSYAEENAASSGVHGCSLSMLGQIDAICAEVGVYPHAFISAHAHNYQRYTRTVSMGGRTFDVPFIVCGDGGHHVNRIVSAKRGEPGREPHFGTPVNYLDVKQKVDAKGLQLEKYNDSGYGYLRISVDKEQLGVGFHLVGQSSIAQSRFDKVTVNLATHQIVSN